MRQRRGPLAALLVLVLATFRTLSALHQLTHSSLELIERHAKVTRKELSRVMSKIA